MTSQPIAEARAKKHCAQMGPANQMSFLLAFTHARDDVANGADTEASWLRMWQRHERGSTLAGYLEGLASARTDRTSGGTVVRHHL